MEHVGAIYPLVTVIGTAFITSSVNLRGLMIESAVFVGRCADYILRDVPNHSSFITAEQAVQIILDYVELCQQYSL